MLPRPRQRRSAGTHGPGRRSGSTGAARKSREPMHARSSSAGRNANGACVAGRRRRRQARRLDAGKDATPRDPLQPDRSTVLQLEPVAYGEGLAAAPGMNGIETQSVQCADLYAASNDRAVQPDSCRASSCQSTGARQSEEAAGHVSACPCIERHVAPMSDSASKRA